MRIRTDLLLASFAVLLLSFPVFAESPPENHPPVAMASIWEDPEDLWTGISIHFSSAGSHDIDGEGRISYTWDFGDGTEPSYLPNPIHVYELPGTYTVNLTVIDSKTVTDTASLALDVQFNYGDTEAIIFALGKKSDRGFKDPDPGQMRQVAVKRGGWVAYLCDLDKKERISVKVTVIGDRPADVYLFKHEDFLTYKEERHVDEMPSELEGFRQNVTGEFRYEFTAEERCRHYIVIDNRDWPPGTDTQGPVDYTITVDPIYETTPPDTWDTLCAMGGPVVGMALVIIAMIVVFNFLRRWDRS